MCSSDLTISTARDPGYTKIGTSSKLVDFIISGRFHGHLHTVFFGSGTISTARDPGYTKTGTSSKLVDFVISGRFHGQLHTIFYAPGRFQRLVTPGTQKLGNRQNSPVRSFLAVFMGHTVFFGSWTISTARDPQYTKIGTSSKLVDFVISGHFRGR